MRFNEYAPRKTLVVAVRQSHSMPPSPQKMDSNQAQTAADIISSRVCLCCFCRVVVARHAETYPEFWFCHHQPRRPETPSARPSYSETLQGPCVPWPQLSPWSSPSVCSSPLCHPDQTASVQKKHTKQVRLTVL